MRPSSRSQSAATTALTAGIGELFRVKRLREIPQWWILGYDYHNVYLAEMQKCLDLHLCSENTCLKNQDVIKH